MKITFFIDEKLQMEVKKTKEWKSLNLIFERMGYDMIILGNLKYAAFFNGKPFVFNMGEILYLESYYRKTSVMIKDGRLRIKARLNDEEQRLPKEWFIRISRHNIVNMQHVRSVKGEEVEMVNGDVLYISHNRRKEFEKGYRDFLKFNDILV